MWGGKGWRINKFIKAGLGMAGYGTAGPGPAMQGMDLLILTKRMNKMEQLTVMLKSNGPMLMHSDKLSNPLDPATKKHKTLTSKRKKTDEDYEAIAKSEWLNSLYYSDDIGVYVPIQNIRKSLIEGARFNKLGKHVERGVVFMDTRAKLKYSGPKEPEKLWDNGKFTDARSVRVSQARLVRFRPIFTDWEIEAVELLYNPSIIDGSDILAAWDNAGNMVGMGDFRPLFGKYKVEEV